MTPIFSRIWLMKMRQVRDLATMPVSLRSAWDMRRACKPIEGSPMSPSSSALGTRAATESTTMMSTLLERISVCAISRACSPLSGGDAAEFLGFGYDLQSERGFTAGFRAVDFDDAAAGETADAQREVERQAAGRNDADRHQHVAVAQAHDRTLAVVLFDLRNRCFN